MKAAPPKKLKLALLGAESTGKTQLSQELAAQVRAQGRSVAVVSEVLREWCEREGRTPRPEEQLPIAQEQERRADAAALTHDVVIADTTSLMVAIYSAMLFEDGTLYQFALERQRGYDVTLVTGLDLPWVADGLQRDGPHVREPVDALVRQALARADVPYRTIYGKGTERLQNALAAIAEAGDRKPSAGTSAWVWTCDKCSDPECEHRLFTSLMGHKT
ncbi:AAA family ATPase [Ramlibacter sp. WS9]|uniref:AAA family ATPase n=1 Tax=Ramlibacter sp. WS9 TaxID=1882741 RepID=UPI0011423DB1|nr:ATP-binding protein [Ramlibacter sp. WS9]ROZ62594.1 ATPase [Ramlibacter sp. WS9]